MESPDRTLWAAVVFQARADLDTLDYPSVEYGEAVSFFTDRHGAWAESRQCVADCLRVHSDDLWRLGRATIAARGLRDGGPPVSLRKADTQQPGRSGCTAPQRPAPCLTNPVPAAKRAHRPWNLTPASISRRVA